MFFSPTNEGARNVCLSGFSSSADCQSDNPIQYRRRDFYKISLLDGDYIVNYGDESIAVSGVSLSFFSPMLPYTIEQIEERENAGYFIFTETFYDTYFKKGIQFFPLFQQVEKPIFQLNEEQINVVKGFFRKVEQHSCSNYEMKLIVLLKRLTASPTNNYTFV